MILLITGSSSLWLRECEPSRLEDGFHVGVLMVSVLLSRSNRPVRGVGLYSEREATLVRLLTFTSGRGA